MSNIKDTTANSKREVAMVEMKLQKALQELEEKKSQLMQKIANERTTPEFLNQVIRFFFFLLQNNSLISQILDEKKSIENENRALKQRLDKMTNIINTYDKNAIKQTDELLSYQKETEMLRDHRLTAKNEIKDLNESLANLNRDKVNLMREMTLINDRNVKLEKEVLYLIGLFPANQPFRLMLTESSLKNFKMKSKIINFRWMFMSKSLNPWKIK